MSRKRAGSKQVGKQRAAKRPRTIAGSEDRRLRPGELDKLVCAYMRRHKKEPSHTASAVAKGIERSSGAVANCLARLERQGTVLLTNPKPCRYTLKERKER